MNSTFTLIQELTGIQGCLANKRTTAARRRHEKDDDLIVAGVDPFLIDAELKIASSKAVRRMLDKTQVVTNPHNLHIRKRITHTGEVAAIASRLAGRLYHLQVVASNIEDLRENFTRFLIIGKHTSPPSGNWRSARAKSEVWERARVEVFSSAHAAVSSRE